MVRKKTGNKYITLKLHDKLVDMIDIEVKKRGFTSRADYLKYVCRKDIEQQKDGKTSRKK